MSIKLKYKENEYNADTILWDRDSYFIEFNSYWGRLVGSIAQKIAENTTKNWDNFNLTRTQVIKILGVNPETGIRENSAPVNILPVNIFPSLLASTIKNLSQDVTRDSLTILFQELIEKVLKECQQYIKDSAIIQNIKKVNEINKNAKQILITNDSKINNDLFLKEIKLENVFYEVLPEKNKEQLDNYLKNNCLFITTNDFLRESYLRKSKNNILIVQDIDLLSFDTVTNNDLIIINIDGASRGNPGPSAIGIVVYKLTDGNKEIIEEISEFIGNKTNNFAEYTSLIRALEVCQNKGFQNIEINSDSELVVKQINKIYKVKDADIKELFDKAYELINKFTSFKIKHIPREENLRADKLANNALKQQQH